MIDKALNTIQIIGDIGSRVGSLIPGVGPTVKVITDSLSAITNLITDNNSEKKSTKVNDYNDSFINPKTLTKELNNLKNKENMSTYDKEYLKRYSIINDVYESIKRKDLADASDEILLSKIKNFMDDVKKSKKYLDFDLNNKKKENFNKSTKEIISELQKNENLRYLTNYAKDYFKYKNISNTIPIKD